MELKIINQKEDPLLSRTRIDAEIVFDKSTPSREEIKSKLVNDLGKDEKLVVVKEIYTIRGLKKATNLSYIYKNEVALKRIEPIKKGKSGKEKEAKPEEKTAEKTKVKGEIKQEQKKENTEQKGAEGQEKQKPNDAKTEEISKEKGK